MFERFFNHPLPVGTPAPDFTLPDDAGNEVHLSALRGRNIVLVFYPGDNTPGCTRQLCQLRDSWETARVRGIAVFGVNPQSRKSHAAFRHKYNLPFPLLVDAGHKVASLYNARGLIVKRTVYLVGPDGMIRFARRGMPSPDEVLAAAEAK
jgi:peroxiredoxin Q/BCP